MIKQSSLIERVALFLHNLNAFTVSEGDLQMAKRKHGYCPKLFASYSYTLLQILHIF